MNQLEFDLCCLEHNITPQRIFFTEDYMTIDGVFIILHANKNTPKDDIVNAKSWLRNQLDVIGFKTKRK